MILSGKLAASLVALGLAGGMGQLASHNESARQASHDESSTRAECALASKFDGVNPADHQMAERLRTSFNCGKR